ncbi:T9SS type B sorting domain-containing protein [Segetibacter sp. 3557_3]|uniref:T9SS type B sorting domain-containing protein n=1 Tax=Segetibacter sp. 3557_3 TaxID=2547429 RepID=UPI0010583DED|nr:gliding motility-associated C-terminal domain-containing protein [Segetibacter sp. 3557_3]TDH28793.1 T9SS type B sorting domain-containing protein [Segetibacter sp. 3557_3]
MINRHFCSFLLILFSVVARAQVCTNLGQNPTTAFPVCGSSTFTQTNVPICGQRAIPTRCVGPIFQDKNPYWYKFTCFSAGTLGFVITPNNLNDDYDWQLFDVTGKDPNLVYSDNTMFVACNWSGESGRTGASAAGNSLVVCEGTGRPLFSSMPSLQVNHNYLLLVSHFTNTQSGYSLQFSGGTASITDSTTGKLQSAVPNCGGSQLRVQLSKKMKCNSLAADGSDFTITTATGAILSASGLNCTAGFDMDSLVINFANPLPPGNYTLAVKTGTDGNTILDNCNIGIAPGNSVNFLITPPQPTAFDSIRTVGCAPAELQVVFKKMVRCNSIATDGSDFTLSGLSGVRVVSASVNCANNLGNLVTLKLSAPISTAGIHRVTLNAGSDGNTIIDECGQQTPAGATVQIVTSDTVSARFSYVVNYGCTTDTIALSHPGPSNLTWKWNYSGGTSLQQNLAYVARTSSPQVVRLAVSNGVCSDSSSVTIPLDVKLKAAIAGPSLACPEDVSTFRDTSLGKIRSWLWDFGNGTSSNQQNPPGLRFPQVTRSTNYRVRLTVQNEHNCIDTTSMIVTVLSNCYIAVPTAFSPNGDGLNDHLFPLNAFKATNLTFRVFNRLGQLLFETRDFNSKWDGSFRGVPQGTGTYVWTLTYTHLDTGEHFSLKGTSVLLR